MSQAAVEQILGRLMTDERFRNLFFSGEASLLLTRYPLSETERSALLHSRSTLRQDQFDLQEMPSQVLFDPDTWILCLTEDFQKKGKKIR